MSIFDEAKNAIYGHAIPPERRDVALEILNNFSYNFQDYHASLIALACVHEAQIKELHKRINKLELGGAKIG